MCGIFALLNNTNSIDKNVINYSFQLGENRGPEYSELKNVNEKAVFGFHRLAINGLNSISNQPMTIKNITLICNGEIYNFKELYAMLNVTPTTNSDCEVIIHMYERFGIEYTLKMLDGYFSFILFDNSNISVEPPIYIARDSYGVRPLFVLKTDKSSNIEYFNHNELIKRTKTSDNLIGFASDLKSLNAILSLKNNVTSENNDTIKNELVYSEDIFNNQSLALMSNNIYNFKIEQYPPGTYSKLSKKCHILSSYYFETYAKSYSNFPMIDNYLTDTYDINPVFNRVYDALCSSVKKRVIGTTDRQIACLLSGGLDSSLIAALVSKMYTGKLETYSIGLPDGEDLKYARIVANHIGSNHTEIIVSEEEFFNIIPEVIYKIESYDTTSVRASVGNYLISKYISQHSDAKVIFNGDGSDELTGGYLYFHACPDALSFDKECKRLLSNIHYFDVLRSDKSISSNGLEPRTPFLDSGFVQTYLSIPLQYRYHPDNIEKWLLRKSVEFCDPDLLPSEVLWRTKEAFSDGVSSHNKSWYEIINEKVLTLSDIKLNNYDNEKINKPTTTEQIYYRTLFDNFFPKCSNVIPYFWMPNFVKANDASARTLSLYKMKQNDNYNEHYVTSKLDSIMLD